MKSERASSLRINNLFIQKKIKFKESRSRDHVIWERKTEYQICSVCGYLAEGEAPENCPVCGAGRDRFKQVV